MSAVRIIAVTPRAALILLHILRVRMSHYKCFKLIEGAGEGGAAPQLIVCYKVSLSWLIMTTSTVVGAFGPLPARYLLYTSRMTWC